MGGVAQNVCGSWRSDCTKFIDESWEWHMTVSKQARLIWNGIDYWPLEKGIPRVVASNVLRGDWGLLEHAVFERNFLISFREDVKWANQIQRFCDRSWSIRIDGADGLVLGFKNGILAAEEPVSQSLWYLIYYRQRINWKRKRQQFSTLHDVIDFRGLINAPLRTLVKSTQKFLWKRVYCYRTSESSWPRETFVAEGESIYLIKNYWRLSCVMDRQQKCNGAGRVFYVNIQHFMI